MTKRVLPCWNRRFRWLWSACFVLMMCGSSGFVQAAPGGPLLLSDSASTRAIALESVTMKGEPFGLDSSVAFSPDTRTRLTFFVMNLDLLVGEGANALTADAEDASHKHYPLTVEYVGQVPDFESIYMVVVRLSDEMSGDMGDVLVRLNLHGMASNRVRVGLGHIGGGPADDSGAVPTSAPMPLPAALPRSTPNPYTDPVFATPQDTVRFLEQSTWGPTPALIAHVRSIGYRAFLDEQFAATPSSYPQPSPVPATADTTTCPRNSTCFRDNYSLYPVQVRFYQNGMTGPDQLRQRVAFAFSQILVVSGRDLSDMPSWMAPYLRVIDRNSLGNYRQMLYEMTLNVAMGRYLDMLGNTKTNPNENYAREVLQLFSVGLDQLNTDGTPKLDAQGNRIPTYDQATVTNFARVFTGWTFPPQQVPGIVNYIDPMRVQNENNHDTGSKTLLNGAVLPAGQNSDQDLNAAIDNIYNHPNVGPFICKQLIQHLVTSNPSPAYVERVATVFNNNRSNPNQLQAVVAAILLDPEARGDVKTDPNYGHLREPVQYVLNFLRATNATSDYVISGYNNSPPNYPATMDQDLFRAPSVFNYYQPDYQVPGTSMLGPEFQIYSATTALKRANFINTMVFGNGITGANAPTGTRVDLTSLRALANDPAQMVESLNSLMMHGTMSAGMKASIVNAVAAVDASNSGNVPFDLKRAQYAVYLVATSSQYQVER